MKLQLKWAKFDWTECVCVCAAEGGLMPSLRRMQSNMRNRGRLSVSLWSLFSPGSFRFPDYKSHRLAWGGEQGILPDGRKLYNFLLITGVRLMILYKMF